MKIYVLSLTVGVLVGVLYYLVDVKAPAPPIVALLGLLGIVIGEKLVPFIRLYLSYQDKLYSISHKNEWPKTTHFD